MIAARCQLLEMPAGGLAPQEEGNWPRDLLPWADPYIASLMMKLDKQRGQAEDLLDDEATLYRCAVELWWDEEASLPRLETSRAANYPPIYGGFPLLDDELP
jgi:hypothetical protein